MLEIQKGDEGQEQQKYQTVSIKELTWPITKEINQSIDQKYI